MQGERPWEMGDIKCKYEVIVLQMSTVPLLQLGDFKKYLKVKELKKTDKIEHAFVRQCLWTGV